MCALAVVVVVMVGGRARAAELEGDAGTLIAAHGGHLWVVQLKPEGKFVVLGHDADGPADALEEVWRGTGKPIRIVAFEHTLYTVYSDHSVQGLRQTAGARGPTLDQTQLPPLPGERSDRLMGLVAGRSGPVVLLQRTARADAPKVNLTQPADAPTSAPSLPSPLALYRLQRHQWTELPAPDDLTPDSPALLLMADAPHDSPGIMISHEAGGTTALLTWDNAKQEWTRRDYDWQLMPHAQAVNVAQQTVVVQAERPLAEAGDAADQLGLWLLRDEALSLGGIDVPSDTIVSWRAAAFDDGVAVVFVDRQGQLSWSRTDLEAGPGPTVPLQVQRPSWLSLDGGSVVQMVVVIAATLLVLGSWRRQVQPIPYEPPEGLAPCDLPRRIVAGLIDLIGPWIVSMLVFSIGRPEAVFNQHWPLAGIVWSAMGPGGVVIVLYILHTGISELATGRSLGKRVVGCRVVDQAGGKAKPVQILIRSVTKCLDLVIPWLLLVALFNPRRQRIGDLSARTFVVVDAPPAESDST